MRLAVTFALGVAYALGVVACAPFELTGQWLLGYWTHDWCDEVIRVASYDKEKKVIALAAPHSYGINGGTWGAAKRRFFALPRSATTRSALPRRPATQVRSSSTS